MGMASLAVRPGALKSIAKRTRASRVLARAADATAASARDDSAALPRQAAGQGGGRWASARAAAVAGQGLSSAISSYLDFRTTAQSSAVASQARCPPAAARWVTRSQLRA